MLWRQKGRGKFISLSVYYANHRERIDQNNSVCALVIHASQQRDLPALCNNLLLQSLLQTEELELEQKSSQRHTFQQKSLSLNCNKNGKWKHSAHVLQHSPPTTPKVLTTAYHQKWESIFPPDRVKDPAGCITRTYCVQNRI